MESTPDTAANTMICLNHQTSYLFDQQLRQIDKQFGTVGLTVTIL